jgi:diguanylate cyclase (GGDEF)-like protein
MIYISRRKLLITAWRARIREIPTTGSVISQMDDTEVCIDNSIYNSELQKFQDDFCSLTGICAVCIDSSGRKCTKMSGNAADIVRFGKYISDSQIVRLCRRVSGSELEDEAVEDTIVPDVKYGAVSVGGSLSGGEFVWIAEAALDDPDTEGYIQPPAGGFIRTVSSESFVRILDLIREIRDNTRKAELNEAGGRSDAALSQNYEREIAGIDKRWHSIIEIIQMLDSDDDVEVSLNRLIKTTASYLDISSAQVYKIHPDDPDQIDVVAQSCAGGTVSLFDHTKNLKRLPFLYTDQMMTYIEGQKSDENITNACREMGIRAMVVLPINIRGNICMYICFEEIRDLHNWSVNDIKFMKYVVSIMQAIVKIKVEDHSVEGSFKFLEQVLNNIGNAVYGRDIRTGEVVFANSLAKKEFSAEINDGSLRELFEKDIPEGSKNGCYEVEYAAKQRWYDMNYSELSWVNGSPILLCSIHDETEKKHYQKRIEQQAFTDYLTGLFNRMCCERDLAKYVDFTCTNEAHGVLLYMDLDDFKHINDGLGHQYGDVLLRSIAHSIRHVHGIDNTCYRMGGDEFVIIIPPESSSETDRILNDIRYIFSRPWFLKDTDYYCTMSMGIVRFPEDGTDVQELIKKADIAMYEAKKTGKNRISRYSGAATVISSRRLDMEKYMRDAVADDCKEFEVFYQPIIDMQIPGRPCSGAEALIRWNSPRLGFISPGDFIPLAEYLGLINPIGNYVLREACRACRNWNLHGHPGYKVNVNLSVVQLLQNDIVETVKKALDDTELEPRNLTLEVTESLAINDMSRMQTILSRIRALGARIALDDFGTGYSSLNHIREIPLDVIKVDQSFVRDLSTDSYSQSFIRMVSDLGNTIDKRICVEGIEMEDQYRILEKMNVRLVQGFYFDKPMHLGEFEEKYVENGVVQNEENELKDQKVPKTAVKRTHSEAKKKAVK